MQPIIQYLTAVLGYRTIFAIKNPSLQICFPQKVEPVNTNKIDWRKKFIHIQLAKKDPNNRQCMAAQEGSFPCKTSYVGRRPKTSSAFGLSPFFSTAKKKSPFNRGGGVPLLYQSTLQYQQLLRLHYRGLFAHRDRSSPWKSSPNTCKQAQLKPKLSATTEEGSKRAPATFTVEHYLSLSFFHMGFSNCYYCMM